MSTGKEVTRVVLYLPFPGTVDLVDSTEVMWMTPNLWTWNLRVGVFSLARLEYGASFPEFASGPAEFQRCLFVDQ